MSKQQQSLLIQESSRIFAECSVMHAVDGLVSELFVEVLTDAYEVFGEVFVGAVLIYVAFVVGLAVVLNRVATGDFKPALMVEADFRGPECLRTSVALVELTAMDGIIELDVASMLLAIGDDCVEAHDSESSLSFVDLGPCGLFGMFHNVVVVWLMIGGIAQGNCATPEWNTKRMVRWFSFTDVILMISPAVRAGGDGMANDFRQHGLPVNHANQDTTECSTCISFAAPL